MEEYFYLTMLIVLSLVPVFRFKNFIVVPFIILALFAGFRYGVGIDYFAYINIYNWGVNGAYITKEPFFKYIIIFCELLGGNAQMMILILALITNIFVYKSIIKTSPNVIVSFLLFFSIISFYLFSFNAIRQWAACSLFLFSLSFLSRKEYKEFIIVNAIAILFFHISLIFIIPLIILSTFNINKKFRIILFAFSLFLALSFKTFLNSTIYVDYGEKESELDSVVDMKIYLFLLINIFFDFLRKKFPQTFIHRILFNINFISILLLMIIIIQHSGMVVLLLKRFHNYLLSTYIIFIPYLLSNFHLKKQKLINVVALFLLPLLFLTTVYFLGFNIKLLPFKFDFTIFK